MTSIVFAQTGEVCGLFVALVVFAVIGLAILRSTARMAAWEQVTVRWVVALGTAAGVVVFFAVWFGARENVTASLGLGFVSGLAAGLLLAFVLPILVFIGVYFIAPPCRWLGRCRARAAERRRQRQDEKRRQREQQEHARREPERARAQQTEADARRRREDARASCELLFSLHAPEIGRRFPREAFDDFMKKYLGDDRPPEDVEQRAKQLQEIIHQHLEKAGQPTKKMTLADLALWFQREKEQIERSSLPDDDKVILLAQLEERYIKLQEKLIRGMNP